MEKTFYTFIGDLMKVKIFDEEDEEDLEEDINTFISNTSIELFDIKYQVSVGIFSDEQVYCFSALILYHDLNNSNLIKR